MDQELDGIVDAFDKVIQEAPVDFLGTGSSQSYADMVASEWYDLINPFRERLVKLVERSKLKKTD